MISTASPIITSLIVNGQIPLDGKIFFLTLANLKDLGAGNANAFKYYEGMEAYCNEDKKKYVWREVKQEDPLGVLAVPFTYPAGSSAVGVNYSGRTFNFYEEDKLTPADITNLISSTGIREIVSLPTLQAYKDLITANEDEDGILYLTPEPEQPEWLSS